MIKRGEISLEIVCATLGHLCILNGAMLTETLKG